MRLTLTPLSPELYPVATLSAKVRAFMAERSAALMRFANTHGEGLVVPEKMRLDAPKKLTAGDAKQVLVRELGLNGTIKQVIDQAAEQLGVDAMGRTLVEVGMACLDALG